MSTLDSTHLGIVPYTLKISKLKKSMTSNPKSLLGFKFTSEILSTYAFFDFSVQGFVADHSPTSLQSIPPLLMISFDDLGWRWYWHIHVLHSGLDLSFWFTSEPLRGLLKWHWLEQKFLGVIQSFRIQIQWDVSRTSSIRTMWKPFLDDISIGSTIFWRKVKMWGILFKVGVTGKVIDQLRLHPTAWSS